MAKFLTTGAIGASIEKIIRSAKKKIILVTPYVQLSEMFAHRISEAALTGIPIQIIFGKKRPKPIELQKLPLVPNLSVHYLKNLHAKCYFNEDQMVIGSMNLYKFSSENNFEMAVYIDKKSDTVLYEDAVKETEYIIRIASLIDLKPLYKGVSRKTRNNPSLIVTLPFDSKQNGFTPYPPAIFQLGYCIRCAKKMDYNSKRPLCDTCYSYWSQFGNRDYEEKYCHSCGSLGRSSYAHPECHPCYVANKKIFTESL